MALKTERKRLVKLYQQYKSWRRGAWGEREKYLARMLERMGLITITKTFTNQQGPGYWNWNIKVLPKTTILHQSFTHCKGLEWLASYFTERTSLYGVDTVGINYTYHLGILTFASEDDQNMAILHYGD